MRLFGEESAIINLDSKASITEVEREDGEARHQKIEQYRELAMAAGLTKTSDGLMMVWEAKRGAYLTLLSGAVAEYQQAVK